MASISRIVTIFDVDGILVDNLQFEEEVTKYIIRRLADVKRIGVQEARRWWFATLEEHRGHPEWHDYALHCRALGIEDAWREGHELYRSMLRTFPGVEQAIDAARQAGRCWIASDATKWVVDFKLGQVGLSRFFDEMITVSRWALNKGEKEYWVQVAKLLRGENARIVFIENRFDRIAAALEVLGQCVCVWVQAMDHAEMLGFRSANTYASWERQSVIVATHESLVSTLDELLSEETKADGRPEERRRAGEGAET